jgi:hypothetical protein
MVCPSAGAGGQLLPVGANVVLLLLQEFCEVVESPSNKDFFTPPSQLGQRPNRKAADALFSWPAERANTQVVTTSGFQFVRESMEETSVISLPFSTVPPPPAPRRGRVLFQ